MSASIDKHTKAVRGSFLEKELRRLPTRVVLERTDRSSGPNPGPVLTYVTPVSYSHALGLSFLSCEVGVTIVPFIKWVSKCQAYGTWNGVVIAMYILD